MSDKHVGHIRITKSNDTYFVEGSDLPVYISDDLSLYAVEEYEQGEPVSHPLEDLRSDGIEFVATSYTGINN